MEKYAGKGVRNWWFVGLIFVLVAAVVIVVLWYLRVMGEAKKVGEEEAREFRYHCVYVTGNNEDTFWNSIYAGAKKEGERKDIYVENYGEALSLNYSIEEKMEMAIASGVDAIIVEGIKSTRMTSLIEKASDQGILVITVYSDNVSSLRKSFIGINNFQMGYGIGAEAYRYLDNGIGEIMVLYEEDENKSQDNTILDTGMKKYLDEMQSTAVLNAQMISSNETYDTLEKVRSLLRNEATRPQVLVCTNMLQTNCAYQSVVDLNCVGQVNIIGFYTSQEIREAVEKDIIQATVVVDTEQMGREAVNGIQEFYEYGYSSDYTPINVEIVNKTNIELLKETESGQ